MPTTNPVPSQSPADLPFNAGVMDQVVNGLVLTILDRFGNPIKTIAGINADANSRLALISAAADAQLALQNVAANAQRDNIELSANLFFGQGFYTLPVPYQAGLVISLRTQTVEYNGMQFGPVVAALPFVTSGVFEENKFRLVQGVMATDLASAVGGQMVKTTYGGDGAKLRTLKELYDDALDLRGMDGADSSGQFSSYTAFMKLIDKCRDADGRYLMRGVKAEGKWYFHQPIVIDGYEIGTGTGLDANGFNGSQFFMDIGAMAFAPGAGGGLTVCNQRNPTLRLLGFGTGNDAVYPESDEEAPSFLTVYELERADIDVVTYGYPGRTFTFDGAQGRLLENQKIHITSRTAFKAVHIAGKSPTERASFLGDIRVNDVLSTVGSFVADVYDLILNFENTVKLGRFNTAKATRSLTLSNVGALHGGNISLGDQAPECLKMTNVQGSIASLYVTGDKTQAAGSRTSYGAIITNSNLSIGHLEASYCHYGIIQEAGTILRIGTDASESSDVAYGFRKGDGTGTNVRLTIGNLQNVATHGSVFKVLGPIGGDINVNGGWIRAGNVGAGVDTPAVDLSASGDDQLLFTYDGLRIDAEYPVGIKMVVANRAIGKGDIRSAVPLMDLYGKVGNKTGVTYQVNLPGTFGFGTTATPLWLTNTDLFDIEITVPYAWQAAAAIGEIFDVQLRTPTGSVQSRRVFDKRLTTATVTEEKSATFRVPAGWSYQLAIGSSTHIVLSGGHRAQKAS